MCNDLILEVGNYRAKMSGLLEDGLTPGEQKFDLLLTQDTVVTGEEDTKLIRITQPDGSVNQFYANKVTLIKNAVNGDVMNSSGPNAYLAGITYEKTLRLLQKMSRIKTVPGSVDITNYHPVSLFVDNDIELILPSMGYMGFELELDDNVSLLGIEPPTHEEYHTVFIKIKEGGNRIVIADNSGSTAASWGFVGFPLLSTYGGGVAVFSYDHVIERWVVVSITPTII